MFFFKKKALNNTSLRFHIHNSHFPFLRLKKIKIMKLFCTLCAATLLVALFPLPNYYYTFLRILTSIGVVVILINETKRDVSLTGIIFIAVLILFNPILPIYLYKKYLWMPLDILTSALFLIYGFREKD